MSHKTLDIESVNVGDKLPDLPIELTALELREPGGPGVDHTEELRAQGELSATERKAAIERDCHPRRWLSA